jgi:hypothetical protein
MKISRSISLFNEVYELSFDEKDEDMIDTILKSNPTIPEFEEFCYTWNINYAVQLIHNNDTVVS